jgi:hypothetical protein
MLPRRYGPAAACSAVKGEVMPKEARNALLLTGAACLMAVMVEWVIQDLQQEQKR